MIDFIDMTTLKNKLSVHVEHSVPDFVRADHEVFTEFLKTYYELSTKLP